MKDIPGEHIKIILAIRNIGHGGGAEAIVYDIYRELKSRKGVSVKLVVFQMAEILNTPSLAYFEEQLKDDPDFHFCNSSVNLSLLSKNKIDVTEYIKVVNEFKPHIIHSHLFVAEINARAVLFPGAKYFTHTHDNMKQLAKFSYRTLFKKELLTNFYERLFLIDKYEQVNNRFITISEDTHSYFKKVLPHNLVKNVRLLKNAINTRRFSNVNHERKRDKIRIVNVGAFRDVKNQKFLVDIAEELLRRGQDFSITMLGYGPFYEQVKQKVESKGLQHVINMPANVINVEDYYRDANIYVHVATVEPFGLVFLEAMSAGLPVVSLDGGGNRDLVKDGENGFMIYKQDPVEFADKIIRLHTDKDLYNRIIRNGTAFAQSYDIAPYVDRLIDLYKHA